MPKEPNYYAAGGYDRAAYKRKDEAWVTARRDHPTSRIVPVWRNQNLATKAEGGIPTRAAFLARDQIEGDSGLEIFLAQIEDRAYFARDLSAVEKPLDIIRSDVALEFADLRRVGPLVGNRDGSLMAYARGMLFWHSRHLFCGVCGAPTRSEEAGHVRRCTNPACNAQHFPRTDPAVIMLVHDGDRCLLGRQKIWPKGMHSTLAGFVEPSESLEDTVAREVAEETGIRCTDVTYHSSQPWPFPASLMLGFYARALTTDIQVDELELEAANWFSRDFLKANLKGSSDFFVPPRVAVARRLIDDWLMG
ncbi:MAG: NAD(+) diphosphatase [Stellaceae bacterium]